MTWRRRCRIRDDPRISDHKRLPDAAEEKKEAKNLEIMHIREWTIDFTRHILPRYLQADEREDCLYWQLIRDPAYVNRGCPVQSS